LFGTETKIPNYFQNWEPNGSSFLKKFEKKPRTAQHWSVPDNCQPGKCVTLCDHMHADRAPGKSTRPKKKFNI
jgi:hypothetical protein